MAVLELNVTPVGTDETSMRNSVDRAVDFIKAKGFKYEVTALSTVVEGNADELFDLAKAVHLDLMNEDGTSRLVTSVKLDDRSDKDIGLGNRKKA